MAVAKPARNVLKFITGDQDIFRGAVRILGVLIHAGGTATARLRLFDAVNSVAGEDCFDFDNVGTATLAETKGVMYAEKFALNMSNGISAVLTGAGATAYIYVE